MMKKLKMLKNNIVRPNNETENNEDNYKLQNQDYFKIRNFKNI